MKLTELIGKSWRREFVIILIMNDKKVVEEYIIIGDDSTDSHRDTVKQFTPDDRDINTIFTEGGGYININKDHTVTLEEFSGMYGPADKERTERLVQKIAENEGLEVKIFFDAEFGKMDNNRTKVKQKAVGHLFYRY